MNAALASLQEFGRDETGTEIRVVDPYALNEAAMDAIAAIATGHEAGTTITVLTEMKEADEAGACTASADAPAALETRREAAVNKLRPVATQIAKRLGVRIVVRLAYGVPLHDRFLFVGSRIWHVGHSFNALGSALSAIVEIRDAKVKRQLIKLLDPLFTGGETLIRIMSIRDEILNRAPRPAADANPPSVDDIAAYVRAQSFALPLSVDEFRILSYALYHGAIEDSDLAPYADGLESALRESLRSLPPVDDSRAEEIARQWSDYAPLRGFASNDNTGHLAWALAGLDLVAAAAPQILLGIVGTSGDLARFIDAFIFSGYIPAGTRAQMPARMLASDAKVTVLCAAELLWDRLQRTYQAAIASAERGMRFVRSVCIDGMNCDSVASIERSHVGFFIGKRDRS